MSKNKNKNKNAFNRQVELTAKNALSDALRIADHDLDNYCNGFESAYRNTSITLVTLQQLLITFLYKSYGVLAKGIDIPVDDAFKNGAFDLEADTLDDGEIQKLKNERYKFNDNEVLKNAGRWARLFGGAAIICNDGTALNTPLNLNNIEGRTVEFEAVDRWQLSYSMPNINMRGGVWEFVPQNGRDSNKIFKVHPSRIKIVKGRQMSYIVNQMVQGWGVSAFESIFNDMNLYFKGRNALFELVDEAKIDVLKLDSLQTALMSDSGERAIQRMCDLIAKNKNYKSQVLMSTSDDYQQKQLSFGGLSEISKEIRIMMSSSFDIPVNKLWGEGVTGFGSGEDSLENYNSMIEASVREPLNSVIDWMLQIRCHALFGREVPDLVKTWKNLRVLSALDEQAINEKRVATVMQLFDRQLLSPQEVMEYLKKAQIFISDSKALRGELEDMPLTSKFTEVKDVNEE